MPAGIMADAGFYHLTRMDIAAALPALLGRTLAAGERAVVVCKDEAQVAALDAGLWHAHQPDWLPHGTKATPHPQWQPVYLTVEDENPAGAAFLFRLGGAVAEMAPYKECSICLTAMTRPRWRRRVSAGARRRRRGTRCLLEAGRGRLGEGRLKLNRRDCDIAGFPILDSPGGDG